MSDDEAEISGADLGEGDDDGEGKSGGKKKLIIIILVVVLLIGGGAGAYLGGFIPLGEEAPPETAEHGEGAEGDGHGAASAEGDGHGEAKGDGTGAETAPQVLFYELPEFLVNLQTSGTKPSFLKLVVTLEMPTEESIAQIETVKPRIMDSFQVYLRELRPTDLKGSAGIYRLREELLLRIRKAAHPIPVSDMLFKELIVQ